AEAVVAISNRVRANLMAGGVLEEKITMIYDAVDLERFHPRLRQDNALRRQFPHAKGTLLGIVGRIDRFKRQLDFLHAAARVAGTGAENATFFVIGAPHDLLYHQQVRGFVSANGLAERVIFTGRREDMPEVLASLDALVSLSGGSVMIEAMACGTPVISAAFTPAGQSTIVHDGLTGLHVSSNNGADLEAAIKRIIDYPHLGEWMGRHARRHAETRFSHTTLVAATQGLYDRLL
ncbi:MAG: glycosyltransferase family 4 protein, partial [Planctomycetes bacterium]|nr:glycosyltransferase family 4 protein [Planctomycetota bacterium]